MEMDLEKIKGFKIPRVAPPPVKQPHLAEVSLIFITLFMLMLVIFLC